jgi:(2Fe-2S) ferredoxin
MPMPYKYHVFCCTNRRPEGDPRGSCGAKGSERLRAYMKERAKELGIEATRVNNSGCLDECERGPVIAVYPEGVWYRATCEADIDEILTEHLQNGRPVERLMLRPLS